MTMAACIKANISTGLAHRFRGLGHYHHGGGGGGKQGSIQKDMVLEEPRVLCFILKAPRRGSPSTLGRA
jgi:hypothetical protein